MGKKINNDALVIKRLISEGMKQIKIAKLNKPTNSMICRRITYIMNSIFNKFRIKSNGKQMKISFITVSNYFNEVFGQPKKN